MAERRIKEICDTAIILFINKGYSNTKIRDISAMTHISTGAIYSLFSDKQSIFDFVIRSIMEDSILYGDHTYPIGNDIFTDNLDRVEIMFSGMLKMLDDVLMKNEYSFTRYISDVFDFLYKYGAMYLIFETDEKNYKPYSDSYKKFRTAFFVKNVAIIKKFIDCGELRRTDDLEYMCRMIIEIISWWAMDIRYKTFERRDGAVFDRTKAICMDNLTHAYLLTV